MSPLGTARKRPLDAREKNGLRAAGDDLRHLGKWMHLELAALERKRATIAERMRLLKSVIFGLADLFEVNAPDVELEGLSLQSAPYSTHARRSELTEAFRQALRKSDAALTMHELCQLVRETAPAAWSRRKRPMISARVVLERMLLRGEVDTGTNDSSETTWRWITPQSGNGGRSDALFPYSTEGTSAESAYGSKPKPSLTSSG